MSEQRIIDRDLAFYESEAEEMQRRLYRCPPHQEEHFRSRRDMAKAVAERLRMYRGLIDQGVPHDER